jgi:hypothetical protein
MKRWVLKFCLGLAAAALLCGATRAKPVPVYKGKWGVSVKLTEPAACMNAPAQKKKVMLRVSQKASVLSGQGNMDGELFAFEGKLLKKGFGLSSMREQTIEGKGVCTYARVFEFKNTAVAGSQKIMYRYFEVCLDGAATTWTCQAVYRGEAVKK